MIRVSAVWPESDFKLRVQFTNGEIRCFDMKPYLDYPVYQCLANPGLFALAGTGYGTVVWPNDIDIAPETLYELSEPLERSTVHHQSTAGT
jgi:hypothetical protein